MAQITCSKLEAAIREALKKTAGTITRKDLASLEELKSEELITDLAGLEYATNLTKLWLRSNPIADVSPLAGLNNLTVLGLSGNQITDVSPLAGLNNLTELELYNNQITDVSPLAGLNNLTKLWLSDNQITGDQKEMLREALPSCDINFG